MAIITVWYTYLCFMLEYCWARGKRLVRITAWDIYLYFRILDKANGTGTASVEYKKDHSLPYLPLL